MSDSRVGQPAATSPVRTGDPAGPEDVVALLVRQHGEIHSLFDEVRTTTGDPRRDAFRRLVRLLAVHETAEQEIVHPYARSAISGGPGVVDDRLAEEKASKEQLVALEKTDPDDPAFPALLIQLRDAVLVHARAEERYEFTHLRRLNDPEKLTAMAKAVKAAESMAPTHPHPNVQGAAANLAVGPVTALMDRTRDAMRKAMGKDGGKDPHGDGDGAP